MADIKLVIKIPENYDLSEIQNGSIASKIILNAVANGTPLPKGHGRLIDADELGNDLKERQKSYEHTFGIRQPINEAIKDGIIIASTHIKYAPTIIEADEKR